MSLSNAVSMLVNGDLATILRGPGRCMAPWPPLQFHAFKCSQVLVWEREVFKEAMPPRYLSVLIWMQL